MFEKFEWEETDGAEVNSPSIESASWVSMTYVRRQHPPPMGQEALLVDTGAVHNLTGQDFIERQTQAAMKHGPETTWNRIPGTGRERERNFQALATAPRQPPRQQQYTAPSRMET